MLMKELLLINDNYDLSKDELDLFIQLLERENLLKKYKNYLKKIVPFECFVELLKNNSNVEIINNTIIYKNAFTNEETKLTFLFGNIKYESNVNDTSLKKYFYKLATNYVIIES